MVKDVITVRNTRFLPLVMVGVPLILLYYPAVLLGIFGYGYVIRGGQEVTWYLNLTFIALLLTCASIAFCGLRGHQLLIRLSVYDYLVLLLSTLLLIGSLYSPDFMGGLAKSARFVGLVALPYFLARVILVHPRRVHMLTSTIMYLAACVAGLVVVEQLAPGVLPHFLASEPSESGRAQFMNTNQVPLATLFVMGTIVALSKWDRFRLIYVLPITALLLYATFLTGTRSPVLSLGVVSAVVISSVLVRAPSRGTLILSGVGLLMVIFLASGLYESVPNWHRFQSALTNPGSDASISERQGQQAEAMDMFLANPITGGGTGVLREYPHNIFLELAGELGAVGLVVMVVLVFLAGKRTWVVLSARDLNSEERTLASLVILPFIALLVIKQFSYDMTMHKDLFIFLGAVVNLPLILSRVPQHSSDMPRMEHARVAVNSTHVFPLPQGTTTRERGPL